MSKQTAQGTRWESRLVSQAQAHGRTAERLAKRGIKTEPDVRIDGGEKIPLVAWENWVKRPGQRRRATRMIVMFEEDFWKLVDKQGSRVYDYDCGFYIQAKSTQALSVRSVLEELREAIDQGGYE